MKTPPDQNDDLLNAVLLDEEWQATLKHRALAAFRARQKSRLMIAWMWPVAAALVVMCGVGWWAQLFTPPSIAIVNQQVVKPVAPATGSFGEKDLLGLFPKGSCLIAEIDGKRQLVILDAKIAQEGVSISVEQMRALKARFAAHRPPL